MHQPGRVIAALNLPRRIPDLIAYAKSVAAAMTDDPTFPNPTPPLAAVQADLDALEVAHVRTRTRTIGTASERNAKLAVVVGHLFALRGYVQAVADVSPGLAAAVIASAGMSVKRSSGHAKGDFVAKPARTSGAVRLVARAATTRASYDWQCSTDGTLWVDLERTVRADATVSGLTAGRRYCFRYRTLTRDGVGDWSQVVWLRVG
jgi:hypothetical protein